MVSPITTLENGLRFFNIEGLYTNDEDSSIMVYYMGLAGIYEVDHGISGLHHMAEHEMFKPINLNVPFNGMTTETFMRVDIGTKPYLMSSPDAFDTMYDLLVKWNFGNNPVIMKLHKSSTYSRLKQYAKEIHNEYCYRSNTSILPIDYYMFGNDSFSFCGNDKTLSDIKRINQEFNTMTIDPREVTVCINGGHFTQDQYQKLVGLFANVQSVKKHPPPMIPFARENLFGSILRMDNAPIYRLVFYINNRDIDNLALLPLLGYLIPNLHINYAHRLTHTSFAFIVKDAMSVCDILHYLEKEVYAPLIQYNPQFVPDLYDYIWMERHGLTPTSPDHYQYYLQENKNDIYALLGLMSNAVIRGEYIIVGQRDHMIHPTETAIGEAYTLDQFIFPDDYICDDMYAAKLGSRFGFYQKQKNRLRCMGTPLRRFEPILGTMHNGTIDIYPPLLYYYFTNQIGNPSQTIEHPILNYMNMIIDKQSTQRTNFVFPSHVFHIKTKFDFIVFLIQHPQGTDKDFVLDIYNFEWMQKSRGNLYYLQHVVQVIGDTHISIISSNPTLPEATSLDTELRNYLHSTGYTEPITTIISTKSKSFDFSELRKNITIQVSK